jgi:hypothetical protein
MKNVCANLNDAMTFAKYDDTTRHSITFVNRFNETRTISHLTFDDAMRRAHALRARSYRVVITRMMTI